MLSFNLESDVSVKATHVTFPLISAFPVGVKTRYTSTPVVVASSLDKPLLLNLVHPLSSRLLIVTFELLCR